MIGKLHLFEILSVLLLLPIGSSQMIRRTKNAQAVDPRGPHGCDMARQFIAFCWHNIV